MLPAFRGSDTDRLATYDFLLLINSDDGPIFYHFQRYTAISVENRNFPSLCILRPTEIMFSLEFCNGGSAQKPTMMPLPDRQKVSIRLHIIPAVDGRTDKQNNIIELCMHCMLTTLTLHHTFTVSFQAQNSPFPQIFSTIVC